MKTCIISARDQGHLKPEEADVLLKRDAALEKAGLPAGERKARMIAEVAAEAADRKRRALITEKVVRARVAEVDDFKDAKGRANKAEGLLSILENQGYARMDDIRHQADAIVGLAQGEMEKHLYEYRKGALTGDKRRTMGETAASLDNVAREAFGTGTGDAKARGFYQAWAAVAEDLRVRFNEAGGAIGKLKDWGLPQAHDAQQMLAKGRDAWLNFITPLLDGEKMQHPVTGQKMTAADLRASLEHVYETIVTDGHNTADPTGAQGRGALFRQHADHRFLHFKHGDAWLAYQKAFGSGDIYASMIGHLRSMATDIALMERLGPNPDVVLTHLKQHVTKDAALTGKRDAVASKLKTADAMFEQIKGSANVPVNGFFAASMAGTRNIISAASLGSAPITALSDNATLAMARVYSGLPVANTISDTVKAFSTASRREAADAGLLADNYIQTIQQEARAVAGMTGPNWTRYIADRTHALSGLTPLTQAEKNGFGMAMMHELAKNAGQTWQAMPQPLRKLLDRHGFDAASWDTIRAAGLHAPPEGLTMLRAKEIKASGSRELAERYLAMIYRETRYAVPESSVRSSVTPIGETQAGTVPGELMRSVAQFKSFGVALVMMQSGRIAREIHGGNAVGGAAYAFGLLTATTLLGALSLQLKEIAQGRDPRKMVPDDAKGAAFWSAALLQGGGMGIYGDFLFSNVNRNGGSLAQTTLGPTFDRLDNIRALTVGNALQFAQGEKTNFGREVTRFVKSNMPGSTIWYTRLAWERIVFDNLQRMLDPDAHAAWRRQEAARKKEFGNEFYSRPGSGGIQRGPNLGAIFGGR